VDCTGTRFCLDDYIKRHTMSRSCSRQWMMTSRSESPNGRWHFGNTNALFGTQICLWVRTCVAVVPTVRADSRRLVGRMMHADGYYNPTSLSVVSHVQISGNLSVLSSKTVIS
jgi:hypothetical protein